MKSFIKTSFLKLTLSSCFAVLTLSAAAQVGQSITYGTYFGGIGNDLIIGFDILPDGSIVVGGQTGSFNLEVMQPYQQIYGGGFGDAFIAVFNPDGGLSYSSFFGGSGYDDLEGIRALPDGGYVIVGYTQSTDFPITPGAFQTEFTGSRAGYISRFSHDHTLLWSTFYGGQEFSNVFGLAIDDEMNIYVRGNTVSDDIATSGTHQEEIGPESLAYPFIAKFNAEGERLWSTYFYGNDADDLNWIEASADGQQVYVSGVTASTSGIALNAHQESFNGGQEDGFICAFNAADGTQNWGTYYGGEGYDRIGRGAVDDSGTLFLSGSTASTSDIATAGSHQTELAGEWDGFIVAFTPEGERIWGTYFGGEESDGGGVLSVNGGTLTVAGTSRSFSGIATEDALYPENTINLDDFPPSWAMYLSGFDKSNGLQQWGTYLAPDCYNIARTDMEANSSGKIIISGALNVASILPCPEIITPGAHQPFIDGGDSEAVLMFIQDNTLSVPSEDYEPLSIYPNPASHEAAIDLPDAPFSHMHLQVIDLSGRVVLDVPAFAMGSAIDLDGMAPGLYLVKGAQAGHYFSEKLVVGM